jgi:hypothetical protein
MTQEEKVISDLINEGISLIPIKEDTKKPAQGWGTQKTLGLIELSDLMWKYQTSTVAMRLGHYSGGLICIDVDTKHKSGFDAVILKDLSSFYPDYFAKMRVERTPSGGLHLIYRVQNHEIRSCNVSSRYATEEEILSGSNKTICFLEIKGEGGLSNCYPSNNYVRVSGDKIQELSIEEHTSLMTLLRLYDEIIKVEYVKPNKNYDTIYSDNPFVCFDGSSEADNIFEDHGWRFIRTSGKWNYYAKPNSKGKDVHGVFHLEKRYYKIYTTDGGVDTKAYSPSSLLCQWKFGGDWKELSASLIARGFGKIKKSIEDDIIRRAVKSGKPLVKNISAEGRERYNLLIEESKNKFPYGTFWDEENKISREELYRVAKKLGYFKYKESPVQIDDYIVKRIQPDDFYNGMKAYIKEESIDLLNSYEGFLQNSGKFTISRLDELDTERILKSSKSVSYKFYRNCYVCVTKEEETIMDYSELSQLIFQDDVKDRDYHIQKNYKNGLYYEYLNNAVGVDDYVMKCIGYYAHDHRDEEGYLCIATESCEDFKDGGGSGKNIFWNLFKLITTFKSVAASMIKRDNQFLQSWNFEKVFVMADIPKDFDLIFFKDMITDGAVVRKLYKDEFSVDVSEMAKIGGSSNYSFDDADPGIKRRVRAIEFTDYYTKKGGVSAATGKMFPNDWVELDYVLFDNFMIDCIRTYLMGNNKIEKRDLSSGGWVKQFEQKYTHLYEFIVSHIEEWKMIGGVRADKFMDFYDKWCYQNSIKNKFTSKKINLALEDFCLHNKIGFKKNVSCRDNLGVFTGRKFGVVEDEIISPEIKDDLPF